MNKTFGPFSPQQPQRHPRLSSSFRTPFNYDSAGVNKDSDVAPGAWWCVKAVLRRCVEATIAVAGGSDARVFLNCFGLY
ncbi:hypothetical protein ES288_D09G036300v1 [Gossypium darwinii]|uniref:Uncharacterized protein n=1 Tax=Gossypium darwinii TaxID=34276 RepID=A0A5D2B6K0_GOSDA|nr:hypothetical protein ES288_D09G036300v1 [Gossypium darwinii]